MKSKRSILLCLALVLSMAMALNTTLAYLQDSDSDVNVMTLGNVKIEQHEYERVQKADGTYETVTVTKADGTTTEESYKVQPFTQAKPLYPVTGEHTWDSTYVRWEQLGDASKVNGGQLPLAGLKNIQDKFVLVENTGKSDAYVRTIVAFELGSVAEENWDDVIQVVYASGDEPWDANSVGAVTINGNNYYVMEFVYTGYSWGNYRHEGGILPAGEWTYSSLAQVYMTSTATNEDVEAIDGNKNGTYDILVVSQAVQTAGFSDAETALDEAFGDISADNHPWKDDSQASTVVTVDTDEELADAVAAGEGVVMLGADLTLPEVLNVKGDITIMGNGNTLTAPVNGTRVVNVQDNTEDVSVLLSGVELDGGDKERGISFYNNLGALDVTILNSEIKADSYGVNVASNNSAATLTVKDSTLTGWCAFQTWSANTKATFDNCTLIGTNDMAYAAGYTNFATIVVNEDADNCVLTFNNCVIEANKTSTAAQYHYWDRASGTIVTWNNCTFKVDGAVGSMTQPE